MGPTPIFILRHEAKFQQFGTLFTITSCSYTFVLHSLFHNLIGTHTCQVRSGGEEILRRKDLETLHGINWLNDQANEIMKKESLLLAFTCAWFYWFCVDHQLLLQLHCYTLQLQRSLQSTCIELFLLH